MRVINRYSWGSGTGEYLLYETLVIAWDREAKDIQRHASKTLRGRVDHAAVPLSELFDDHYADTRVNVEDDAVNRVLIQQIEGEQCLSSKERDVLAALKRDPHSSLRGLNSRDVVIVTPSPLLPSRRKCPHLLQRLRHEQAI